MATTSVTINGDNENELKVFFSATYSIGPIRILLKSIEIRHGNGSFNKMKFSDMSVYTQDRFRHFLSKNGFENIVRESLNCI